MAERERTLTTVRRDAITVPGLRLALVAGKGIRTGIPLGLAPVTVGSGEQCDLRVEDASISKRHAAFRVTESGIEVRDLGSKNGTFVGDVEVLSGRVGVGAIVRIGEARLAVQASGEASTIPLSTLPKFGDALGASLTMRALFARLERAAASDTSVLLFGESGTGKELLARGLHDTSSRKGGPFVVFDCGGVAPTLVESELFGYVAGAFTGAVRAHEGVLASADGGTLFLDEIGELPLDLQPKLLRALEAGTYRPVGASTWGRFDARVVAASHRDLKAMVAKKTFRDDLYYRLAVIEARVPPLRERPDDVELLVERILAALRPPKLLADLPPGGLKLLTSHEWPGNVRELKNTVTRLMMFPELGGEAFDAGLRNAGEAGADLHVDAIAARAAAALAPLPLREARDRLVDAFETRYLEAALKTHAGNVSRAATALGVSRQFLHRLLVQHGLREG